MKYKCLPFLSMLYVLLDIFPWLLHNKTISVPIGYSFNNEPYIVASLLITPFWFSLCDIIAEVYGMKISIKLFWSASICIVLIVTYFSFLIDLPSPSFWHEQHSFNYIYENMAHYYCLNIFSIVAAWYTNIYILTKLKILTRGKYFWLRSLGASFIGLIICTVIENICRYMIGSFAHIFNLKELLLNFVWNKSFETIIIILLAFPSSIIVKLIKIIEYNPNEKGINFNPFLKSKSKAHSKEA